jgi:N-acylneuraminate cytidylyltransferase/CMP-N,N'-diacetyllegionaminic acid synthase
LIPARGGSKGIPKKNIVLLGGKPLIYYTIIIALELKKEKVVTEVIVSTDDREIADISKNLGIEVPFMRPKKFALNESKSVDLVLHALNYYEDIDISFNAVILLQPTSPFRNYNDVVNTVNLFKDKDSDSLITGYYDSQLSDLVMYRKKNCFAIPLNNKHNEGIRRQDFDKIYIRNGAVYITKVSYLKKHKKIISDRPLLYEMPMNRSINIDSYKDLEKAECFLKKLEF